MSFDPQALELNETIRSANPNVYDLLSDRGKAIFFPKRGILSQSKEAKGKKINATIGTALEDNGKPMALDTLSQMVKLESESFSYAPSPGRPEIRTAWKEMLYKKNPSLAGKSISQPMVSCALTHGLSMAGYLFINPGDVIISPDLYWENYDLVFNLAYGGIIETFPTFVKNKGFNVEALRSKLLQGPVGKKVVILNFPNNPTGYTITNEEAVKIREIFVEAAEKGNRIVVLIDDAYFGLVFEKGILKESIFSFLSDAHERILAVKLDGPTKEDYVWGFRVGFMTFGIASGTATLYGALESKLAGAIRGNISNASNLSQMLLISAYSHPGYDSEKVAKYEILKRRYEKIKNVFTLHPEYKEVFEPLPFNSGYFMCVKLLEADGEAVRKVLLDKYSTGVIAQGPILRIAFSSTPLDVIETLFDNVYNAALECVKHVANAKR